MTSRDDPKGGRYQGRFAELLKVEGKLALREPTGIGMGVIAPIIFVVIFGLIGIASPGNVGSTNYTVLDIYVPIIMVISFILLGVSFQPVTLVKYREMGWLRRISVTPVPTSRLLAAQLIVNLGLAVVAVLIVIFGSELIFGAALDEVNVYFVLSLVLSIAVIFSLGLVVAALAPSQQVTTGLTGGLTFLLLFLSGLWLPPSTVGAPLSTIMYYSPSGAAVNALLSSVFNAAPPLTAIGAMVVYTAIFAFVAIRYFRWE
jgi:ABC-2 type transport system permease protein